MKRKLLPWLLLVPGLGLFAQNLPEMIHLSPDGHRLMTGGVTPDGIYTEAQVQDIKLWFSQANYLQSLENNYDSGTDLAATLIINGDTLASPVGVRYKGTTSYFMNPDDKKSFNISLDFEDPDQDYEGHTTLNLNCGYLDPSAMREVLYLHNIRQHTPAAKGNYTVLSVNGNDWGLYENVEQLDDKFMREWFLSDNGTRWRAIKPGSFQPGPGGGPGGPFGTGYSSLNYLGTDTTEYQDFYTLKKSNKNNPWDDLVTVTDILENTPLATLESAINEKMDLDRTLWFLAQEILYSDDDGYVFKGGMDYYLWWESETDRMTPLEYDGNTVMEQANTGWGPFYHQNDDRYPLLFRLLDVPAIRQRYLAHVRTLLSENFTQDQLNEQIDTYFDLISTHVQNDPIAIYSYNEFLTSKEYLKTFVQGKRNLFLANTEVTQPAPVISNVKWQVDGNDWQSPDPGETVLVTAQVASPVAGIAAVQLYFATGIVGAFSTIPMFDDGAHDDGNAGDGLYGAAIPAQGNGTYARFYVEAIAANPAAARTYYPSGAEHDVFFYRTGITETVATEIVINELMASNTATAADEAGEFDDWIELYNKSDNTLSLSGWYLTDSDLDLTKWAFPQGTELGAHEYLIVWADNDTEQGDLHATFKLAAEGETLWLIDPELRIAQEIAFGQQEPDQGYARIPNGTGDFVLKNPTFGFNNEAATATEGIVSNVSFYIYPNPAQVAFTILREDPAVEKVLIYDVLGKEVFTSVAGQRLEVVTSGWAKGVYFIRIRDEVKRVVVE